MPAPLSGPGLGLQLPQNLYPSELQNAPYDTPTNKLALAPGDCLVIPAGDWYINLGMYNVLQFLDPVTGLWALGPDQAYAGPFTFLKSDGFTTRVANLTGCIVGAAITAQGSAYVQASTTISIVGASGVAMTPIVGGALAVVGGTLTSNGAGYGVAPLVMIPAPPPAANNANGIGGIAASAYATIANGTVSAISFTNPGAGYPTAPIAVIVPSPFDPNINVGITNATVAFSLTNAGAITGVMTSNNGAPLTNGSLSNVTLTVAGAGTGATVSAIVMQTAVSASVAGTGVGYGTVGIGVQTFGGVPTAGTITNGPDFNNLGWKPRPVNITLPSVTANGLGTVYDGGLFLSAPVPYIVGGAPSTVGTVVLTMGSRPDIVTLQPAP